jgi:hypothetical protein
MLQLIGLKCKKSEEGEKCSSSYHCFHEEGRKEGRDIDIWGDLFFACRNCSCHTT